MQGFEPAPAPGPDDLLELADRLRELSNDVDQFAAMHSDVLTPAESATCRHSSLALTDAFHILLGDDLDARIQTAKAGIARLKQVTSDADATIRKIKKIETGVKVIIALGSVALGIVEKDPGAIEDAASELASALQANPGRPGDHRETPAPS